MTFEWTCPFCDRDQIVTKANRHHTFHPMHIGESSYGNVGATISSIRCLNAECNEVYLETVFRLSEYNGINWNPGATIRKFILRPESLVKSYPDFIPDALLEDYQEACLIRDKSPKASATLARRCLQGMIRDFCGIAKGRLIDEIKELGRRVEQGTAPRGVEHETVEAIDAVRSVGNIGAHMERDISVIVDVDPGEAQTLIELIEMLFDEWYIARRKREDRLARVKAVAIEKKAAKNRQVEEQDDPSQTLLLTGQGSDTSQSDRKVV